MTSQHGDRQAPSSAAEKVPSSSADRGETRYSESPPPADAGATRYDLAVADAQATNYSAPDPAATRYTPTVEYAAHTKLPLPFAFGNYVLLERLAEGGMGVVYKARQQSPDRLVALKMIRPGTLVGEDDVRRFRQEADQAGGLDHRHIVPVYDFGAVGGQHYFSMKLVEGGALSRHLDRFKDDPRAAARLLASVARAVHHAHQHRLLHRDLKPGNVLLDAEGQPHVADFGLAKRLGAEGETTLPGAVVGTPEYMAPEQARGERGLTTAADVWGLGAILYALLTGRPPFRAASLIETLRLVTEADPVPPRALNPKVPRDLETVCLKCLQKDPGQRYGSAEALAEELERWLTGEPIRARPAGRLERAAKWARRNPAVAGLLAAFVTALLAGTAFSTYFAIESDANFRAASQREDEKKQALVKVSAANTKLEEMVARGLLLPLGQADRVTEPEVKAVWQLAESNDRVRLLFVEQALRDPTTTRQLRSRAPLAMHAAVGLDAELRRRAEEVVLARLRNQPDPRLRVEEVLIGLAAGGPSPEFTAAATRVVLEALDGETLQDALGSLGEALVALAPRLGSGEAATAARLALKATGRTGNAYGPWPLATGLAAVAARLGPRDAAEVSRLTREVMEKTTRAEVLGELPRVVAALADRLEPEEAALAARSLLKLMNRTGQPAALDNLVEAAKALALRLDAPGSAAAVRLALETMDETFNTVSAEFRARALTALAARLDPEGAAALIRLALEAMGKTTDRYALSARTHAVAALAARLDPGQAAARAGAAARLVVARMAQTPDEYQLESLAVAVAAVTARLEPGEASAQAVAAARVVLKAIREGKVRNPMTRWALELAPRLDPEGAATVTRLALEAMVANEAAVNMLAGVVKEWAPRLAPKEAAEFLPAVLRALGKASGGNVTQPLAGAATALAARLGARAAAAATPLVLETMRQAEYLDVKVLLLEVLAPLLERQDPKEAAAIAGQLARNVLQAMRGVDDPGKLTLLARALAALAPQLAPREAASVAEAVRKVRKPLAEATDLSASEGLARTAAALAPWLDPQEAEVTTRAVVEAMGKTSYFHSGLAEAVVALAARLDPKAPATARLVREAVGRAPREFTLLPPRDLLPGLVARLDAGEAAAVVRLVLEGTGEGSGYEEWGSWLVAALLVRPEPAEAPRRVGLLGGALGPLATPWTLLAGLAPLAEASRPWPGRFSEQSLVDFLKMPTAGRRARQEVVAQLGRQCGRHFADEWEFVAWAREHRPDLDLTSPPTHPVKP